MSRQCMYKEEDLDTGHAVGPQCENLADWTNCDGLAHVVCEAHKCRCSKLINWGDAAVQFGPFKVLVFTGTDNWLAQCLDPDICVQAPTPELLQKRFWKCLAGEILIAIHECRVLPFEHIKPAPKEFQDRYSAALTAGLTKWPPSKSE